MIRRDVLLISIVCLLLGIVFLGGIVAQQAAPKAMVQFQEKRGGIPNVVLITKETPDTWQLCAQRLDNDQVDCRSIGESRKWLRERPTAAR